MAARSRVGRDAVLSHRSAAHSGGSCRRSAGRSEVTRPRGWRRAAPGVRVHQAACCPTTRLCRSTASRSPRSSRTIFDLAGDASTPRQLERAFNEADVRRLTDRVSLPTLLERHPGRRGAARAQRLLDDAASVGRRSPEASSRSGSWLSLDAPRSAAAAAERRRSRCAGRFFEVDCLWRTAAPDRRARRARAPMAPDSAFEADRERDRMLLAEGWRVDSRHLAAAAGRTGRDRRRTCEALLAAAARHRAVGRASTLRRMESGAFRALSARRARGAARPPDGAFTGAAGGAACGDLSRHLPH